MEALIVILVLVCFGHTADVCVLASNYLMNVPSSPIAGNERKDLIVSD